MQKDVDAFRTISEVADDLAVPQHVLRFWEMRFAQIKPMKRSGGRRYYRPDDVDLLRGIKRLLYGEGYTIKGVQRILKEQGARAVAALGRPGSIAPPRPMLADSAEEAQGGLSEALDASDLRPHPLGSGSSDPDFPDAAELGMGALHMGALDDDARASADLAGAVDVGVLRGALAEIEECLRLLAIAREA
jgi:DNA-binding transcriptional MerR regulator